MMYWWSTSVGRVMNGKEYRKPERGNQECQDAATQFEETVLTPPMRVFASRKRKIRFLLTVFPELPLIKIDLT